MADRSLLTVLRSRLRRSAIAIFRRFNPGVISIRHHYTGERFRLHSFQHKGYWFYGRRREQESMESFARLVNPGDTVVEVGGHIGYITIYLASLVKDHGSVVVFEPGPNNLPYIRENIRGRSNVHLIEKAATDFCGTTSFYIETYTGQNNSLLPNYSWFDDNLRNAGLESRVRRSVVEVACTTLDEHLADSAWAMPGFIKIDVEGAELAVLRGMQRTLRVENLALMVEVTENAAAIYELLTTAGFQAFTSGGESMESVARLSGNTFWLRERDPRYHIFRRSGS